MNPLLHGDRTHRWVHPVAWWTWALGGAASALATSNPLALALIAIAALAVLSVNTRHQPTRSGTLLLRLAALVIGLRIIMQLLLGAVGGEHILVRLPEVPLPGVLSGISLGGVVTWESLAYAVVEGLRFATILVVFAAAVVVAPPARLFRVLPASMTAMASVFIITVTFLPHLLTDAARVRAAQRLRGRRAVGVRAAARMLLPVIDGALERSQTLAAAMASRGYGSRGLQRGAPHWSGYAIGWSLIVLVVGTLTDSLPRGPVLAAVTALLGSAGWRVHRTLTTTADRHRPDPWRRIESATALSGALAVLGTSWAATQGATALPIEPLRWPTLSLAYAVALFGLFLPAFTAPGLPSASEVVA